MWPGTGGLVRTEAAPELPRPDEALAGLRRLGWAYWGR